MVLLVLCMILVSSPRVQQLFTQHVSAHIMRVSCCSHHAALLVQKAACRRDLAHSLLSADAVYSGLARRVVTGVGNPYQMVAMLRCVCVFAQADLLGVMVWWNVQLNAVSLVNLVMVRIPLATLILHGTHQIRNRAQILHPCIIEWHRSDVELQQALDR